MSSQPSLIRRSILVWSVWHIWEDLSVIVNLESPMSNVRLNLKYPIQLYVRTLVSDQFWSSTSFGHICYKISHG